MRLKTNIIFFFAATSLFVFGIILFTDSIAAYAISHFRDWTYRVAVEGDGPTWKANETYGKDALWIYRYYSSFKGGAKCNNVAYFYGTILRLLHIQSYEYHFGEEKGFNHVVNLVKVKERDRHIVSVQDAYYNMTFRDRQGKLLDFMHMVDLIRRKQFDEIQMEPAASPTKGHLYDLQTANKLPSSIRHATVSASTEIFYYPTRRPDKKLYYEMFIKPRFFEDLSIAGWDWGRIESLLKQ